MSNQQIHFLTGRLAENALRDVLKSFANDVGVSFTIQVMPITVAALMTPEWILRRIEIPKGTDRVVLPGYCHGDLSELRTHLGIPIDLGPKDLRNLPHFFGKRQSKPNLDNYNIDIIAEINHVPDLAVSKVVQIAMSLSQLGADIIDVGCIPGQTCNRIGEYVKALVDSGLRVSIDSLNIDEISKATAAGAELVLSVNASNRDAAVDWGCEVVIIPDEIKNISSMQKTIDQLVDQKVSFRIDPILEPIGTGFAESLNRYWQARKRWPEIEMMMGIGNLTELTDVDSAGVNFLLLGICEELEIRSILTTQVINWARSSVSECEIARRLVHFACQKRIPPKNLSEKLIVLRDARVLRYTNSQIEHLAGRIVDNNYRILNSEGEIHLLGSGQKFSGRDPFEIFDELAATEPTNLDASHAFYLGYEMCKAMTAQHLGKNYIQDESLDWGHLTVDEQNRHRLSKKRRTDANK